MKPATVANRSNGRGCPDCSGHGRSAFERKVAMLVEAASGLTVDLDHRLRLPGRRQDRFDLCLPDMGLFVDLDPTWGHHKSASLVRDTAKTRAALDAGLDLERIRERGLPPIPIDGFTHHEAGPGVDPRDWADVVGSMLRCRGRAWKDLDATQVTEALTKASLLWQSVVAEPPVVALDAAPHLADEFVANLTNPERGPDRMPPGWTGVATTTASPTGSATRRRT